MKRFCKRALAVLLSAVLIIGLAPAAELAGLRDFLSVTAAAARPAGGSTLADWNYTLDDNAGTVTLTKYIGEDDSVVVPASFEEEGQTYSALIYSYTAFRSNTNLTFVTISEGVGFAYNTMYQLFAYCSALTYVDLSGVDTSGVTSMSYMFTDCSSLQEVDLSSFDTSSVTAIRAMFSGCTKLSGLTGYENWDTSALKDIGFAFNKFAYSVSASTRVSLDLSRWDLSKITDSKACFQNCYAQQVLLPDNLVLMGSFFLNHVARYEGTSFTVPAGVKKVGYAHAIYDFGTNDLTEIRVAEGNTDYIAVDGILYSADGTEMLAVPRNKPFENGVFEIPEGVDFLGELSFSRNYNIHTVILPDSYEIRYVPLYDQRYDYENINAGSNLSVAIYCYTGITDYAVKATNPRYTSVDGIIYSKDMKHAVAIPARYNKVMNIPEGVTDWDKEAMWADGSSTVDNLLANCSGVNIPSTLKTISDDQLEMLNRLYTNRKNKSNPFTITIAQGNRYFSMSQDGIVAVPQNYTIRFDKNSADAYVNDPADEMQDVVVNLGENYEMPDCNYVRDGYSFRGWALTSTGEVIYDAGEIYRDIASAGGETVTLYAVWAPRSYSIFFNGNGATSGSMAAQQVYFDDTVNLHQNGFTKAGSAFAGWALSLERAQNGQCDYTDGAPFTMRTNGVTLYAVWGSAEVPVMWDCFGGTVNGQAYVTTYPTYGQNIIFPSSVPTRMGYIFGNWWDDPLEGNQIMGDMTVDFTEATVFYAHWTPITYTVVYNKNADDATGETNPTTHIYDVAKTLSTCGFARPGYSFRSWNTRPDGSGASYYGNGIVKYNNLAYSDGATVTLYAIWDINSFHINFVANGGSGDLAGITVTYDTAFTFPSVTRWGYTFAGWFDNAGFTGTGKNIGETEIVTKDTTYYAKWTPDGYTVTFLGEDGTVLDTQTVPAGTAATAPAAPEVAGKVFVGWDTDFSNVTADLTVTAQYREPVCELRADGKYYIDGVAVPAYYGLIEYEGDYYYIKDNARIVKSKTVYVSTTNGLTFPNGDIIQQGNYEFDADGKMVIKQGVQADGKYYINGLAVPAYYGLVEWEGDFYYIKDNALIVRSRTCYINTTNGLTLPNGSPIQNKYYEFDADGKLMIKQGIQADGKYYVDGVAVPSYYGLVLWEGDFYYIKDNAQIVRSKTCQVNTTNDLTFPNGEAIKQGGYYEFDADGKMIIKQGIQSDGKYYINGLAVGSYYGLVLWEGDFYYIKDNAQIVRSKTCQVNTLNGLTFPNGDTIKQGGYYEFDADGKMIIKQGIQSDGKYYINGVAVPSYYGLVEDGGYYYYIKDNAQIVRSKTIRVNTTNGLTFPDGTPIPKGDYTFDADGRMVY